MPTKTTGHAVRAVQRRRHCLEFQFDDSSRDFKEDHMSTSEGHSTGTYGLSDAQYDEAISQALRRIETQVDRWLEDDVADIDAARSGGMVTLVLPDRSQLIVNAQPPLHELWLAAKRGGFHFRLAADGRWLDTRSGEEFFSLLSSCASEQTRLALNF
jgi:CyaY protein